MASEHHVELFGINLDAFHMQEAVGELLTWLHGPQDRCRYVVTPNVNHAVLYQQNQAFSEAYSDADLVLADGAPLVLASRLFGKRLPERVAGSDLVPALFSAACRENPLSVFLLGAAPGVSDRAKSRIESQWPAVRVVGTYSPPFGFENDEAENRRILDLIGDAGPDLLIIGLGAPKQELWVHRYRHEIKAQAAVCAGATIGFLAGNKQRAPRWMRRSGLEWVHRIACEPRRLFGRYAHDACVLPSLLWREWRVARRRSTPKPGDPPAPSALSSS